MPKLKPLVMLCQYAVYVIGQEYQQRQQRETVWGQLAAAPK